MTDNRLHDRSPTQAQISISLPKDLLDKIDKAAAKDFRNRSNLICMILHSWLEGQTKKKKKK